jgi:hypothetical protein
LRRGAHSQTLFEHASALNDYLITSFQTSPDYRWFATRGFEFYAAPHGATIDYLIHVVPVSRRLQRCTWNRQLILHFQR